MLLGVSLYFLSGGKRNSLSARSSHPTGNRNFKLHMVSAWATANGISLGQLKVNEKHNEIVAIPLLLEALDLVKCIVTIDAMGVKRILLKK